MTISADLEQILIRSNPWLWDSDRWEKERELRQPIDFIPRNIKNWDRTFTRDKVTLVVGLRRAGKSTFLWSEIKEIGMHGLFVNCEEPLFKSWCKSPTLFWTDVRELISSPSVLLFDEVQHLTEAGLFLKGLVDLRPGCPVLATGSSAFHLKSKTRESLAGRATRLRLLPFSLYEISRQYENLAPLVRRTELSLRFERMLVYGSYLESWLSDQPEKILSELFSQPSGKKLVNTPQSSLMAVSFIYCL